jgi:hypothetical protein
LPQDGEPLRQWSSEFVPTVQEYRRRAQECFQLAKEAREPYAKEALTELAEEFNKAADKLERKSAASASA